MKIAHTALALIIISLVILFWRLDLWHIDYSTPVFAYAGDGMSTLFLNKNIISEGWIFSNERIGLPHLTESYKFYDYPINADALNFLLIKFIALFSQDPIAVTNYFFIATFPLITLTCFIALDQMGLGIFTASVISVLYSFTPYHLMRGAGHLMLSNYMMVPLIIMMATWIISGELKLIGLNKKQQFSFSPNQKFFISILICLFSATTGVYYGFYCSIFLFFAWMIRIMQNSRIFTEDNLISPILIAVVCASLLLISTPSILYIAHNGLNHHMAARGNIESELYGLRIVNLLLPTSEIVDGFISKNIGGNGEHVAERLGVLGSAGFLFLLLWLLIRNETSPKSLYQKICNKFRLNFEDKKLITIFANLNLLTVLFSTMGGFVMFIAYFFTGIRSHARMSIFIAFLSLAAIAVLFNRISKNNSYARPIILLIGLLALINQTSFVGHDQKNLFRFQSDKNFIESIEASMPKGSKIFVLPAFGFPEEAGDSYHGVIGYLYSKDLLWSYPVVKGRSSHEWIKETIKLDFNKFIAELRKQGFSGIYIERKRFTKYSKNDWENFDSFEKKLQKLQKKPPLFSADEDLSFFAI